VNRMPPDSPSKVHSHSDKELTVGTCSLLSKSPSLLTNHMADIDKNRHCYNQEQQKT